MYNLQLALCTCGPSIFEIPQMQFQPTVNCIKCSTPDPSTKQHELHGSTYTRICFQQQILHKCNGKYNTSGSWLKVQTLNHGIWRANYKLYLDFSLWGGSVPQLPVVEGSMAFTIEKKFMYNRTCSVQTTVVQGSTI